MRHFRYETNMAIVRRYVYALVFSCGERCYVGLSTDPGRRMKQHRRAWPDDFEMLILGEITDNVWEANRLEFAWRWAAHRAGLQVYASPPDEVFADLEGTVWPEVKALGEGLKWPTI